MKEIASLHRSSSFMCAIHQTWQSAAQLQLRLIRMRRQAPMCPRSGHGIRGNVQRRHVIRTSYTTRPRNACYESAMVRLPRSRRLHKQCGHSPAQKPITGQLIEIESGLVIHFLGSQQELLGPLQ